MNAEKSNERPLRVGLISLGCAKNLVDAEIMLGSLLQDGVEIVNEAAQADAVIVNTCSFIDAAQEESVDAILESAQWREAVRPGQAVIVSGCLPQRFRDELPKLLPEVDAFMGIDQVAHATEIVKQAIALRASRHVEGRGPKVESRKSKTLRRLAHVESKQVAKPNERASHSAHPDTTATGTTAQANGPSTLDPRPSTPLLDVTRRPRYIPDFATPRFRLTPRHFAYVKIAEGCNHPCTFCIIPRMRGVHRSRAQADIVEEARRLLADGTKELNLISQDSTYYGMDLRPPPHGGMASPEKFTAAARALPGQATPLCSLLRELNDLPGDFWIRLLYTHPAHWTDELIRTIAECPKVARYVDMPLQHIQHNLLERMRRETSQQYIIDLIRRIRAGIPGIALRTTFIVGFPGETEAAFQTLLDFIRDTKFERLGVFIYSQEHGTIAGRMDNQIADKIKRRRRDLAMAEQRDVARAVSASFVGRTLKVLVEKQAKARELKQASVFSWEHGLIRRPDTGNLKLETRNYWVARGEADAPDIDGRVYVRGRLSPGEFALVRVVGHTDYDLMAELA